MAFKSGTQLFPSSIGIKVASCQSSKCEKKLHVHFPIRYLKICTFWSSWARKGLLIYLFLRSLAWPPHALEHTHYQNNIGKNMKGGCEIVTHHGLNVIYEKNVNRGTMVPWAKQRDRISANTCSKCAPALHPFLRLPQYQTEEIEVWLF